MSDTNSTIMTTLWAVAAAVVSGYVSAATLEPIMHVMETLVDTGVLGFLSPFALSAGLSFGVLGAAVAIWKMRVSATAAGVFLITSMAGIAAAVYVAILCFDNANDSFLTAYTVGSPIGALIVAVPFALLGRFNRPWVTIGCATALPTLWAIGVGALIDGEAALEVPGLATLYIGWQVLLLGTFAVAGRRA